MEYFVISAKFVPLKYYTLSTQLRRLTSFSVGLFGSANSVTRSYPVMRKSCINLLNFALASQRNHMKTNFDQTMYYTKFHYHNPVTQARNICRQWIQYSNFKLTQVCPLSATTCLIMLVIG